MKDQLLKLETKTIIIFKYIIIIFSVFTNFLINK